MNETIYPNSSMIESYSYDPEEQVLTVVFKRGGTYDYNNVPEYVFEEMKSAPSAGKYFLANIKGQY